MSTEQDKGKYTNMNRNPNGKGGFGDNPQNINPGGRPKNEQRFSYWLQFFKDMTVGELEEYTKNRPMSEMYVAEAISYQRVLGSQKNLNEYRELANRTEGTPRQSIEVTGKDGGAIEIDTNTPKADRLYNKFVELMEQEYGTKQNPPGS